MKTEETETFRRQKATPNKIKAW